MSVGQISQPGLGPCDVCELDRKGVAHIVAREAGTEIHGEANVKLAARKREEIVGVDEDIDAEQIVIGNAAPQSTHQVSKWVDNEEHRRFDSVSNKLGTIAEPPAK